VTRRRSLTYVAACFAVRAEGTKVLRGRLAKDRKINGISVRGDESVEAVLADERVLGMDIEVEGESSNGAFQANPIHTKPVHTYANGKRLIVSYWCDVCYIRFYKPGTCWCCQKESVLDPKDPNTPERVP
jgi:hypothetical protein